MTNLSLLFARKGVTMQDMNKHALSSETLQQLMDDAAKLRRQTFEMQYSQSACLGYLILALQELGYPEEAIYKAATTMRTMLDMISANEAANYFRNSPF